MAEIAPPSSILQRAAPLPEWFVPPDLNPRGVKLEPLELGGGVYALLADRPPVNNSGFVVGERGVLVVDACLNGAMAMQIQEEIRRVTDKPILYLVVTSNHGDHHLGAYAFPSETRVVAHRLTAASMRDFEGEVGFVRWLLGEEAAREELEGVRPRSADILFDQRLVLDLGGREVEIHRFGPGESSGDTVVYVRDAELAFTGNLVRAEGSVPCLMEHPAAEFCQTIKRFRQALSLRLIIPGHGVLGTPAALDLYEQYLEQLLRRTEELHRQGLGREAAVTLGEELWTTFGPVAEEDAAVAYARGLHRLNAETTFDRCCDGDSGEWPQVATS